MATIRYEFISPKFVSWKRSGTCVQVEGVLYGFSMEDLDEVSIRIGDRRMRCSVQPNHINSCTGPSCRFRVVYRLGRGFKLMRFFYTLNGGSPVSFATRFFWVGSEDVGEKVQVPPRGRDLPDGVNVVGLFRYSLGLGEAARNTYRCLRDSNFPSCAVNAPLVQNSSLCDDFSADELTNRLKHRINLFHINAPEMEAIHKRWPRVFRNKQYNIGYWFFELSQLPEDWLKGLRGLDEIWVASEFVRAAVAASSNVPVFLVPTPVFTQSVPKVGRAFFGIPQDVFCVLSVFDLNSHHLRKNPAAAISAFRMASQKSRNMHLVVKVNNADKNISSMEALHASLSELDNCTLITDFLPRDQLSALQACCDVFISLHRSEGLGLNLLECMLRAKPVVATNWSANVDYMTDENSCPVGYKLVEIEETFGPYKKGQVWAQPSVDQAAGYLVELAGDPELCEQIGRLGRQTVIEKYSPQICRRAMIDRLRSIKSNL